MKCAGKQSRQNERGEPELIGYVVPRAERSLSSRELREFAAARLADFKVPKKILLLEEIPKGATGKLQRIGLAQKLGLG